MSDQTVRLDKYLSSLGICSRRNVGQFLKGQNLSVNGKRVIEPGTRVHLKTATITLNGTLFKKPKLVYYLVNKPSGIISTADDEFGRQDVTSLIPSKERVFPVGRLDKDTTGLIILTNDGELTNLLTHPKYQVHKTYRLTIRGHIKQHQIEEFQEGVDLPDGKTAPAGVFVVKEGSVSIVEMTIHEGRNRQIRRMCEKVGIMLLSLERIKFGPLEIGNLREGKYRVLTDKEVSELRKSVVH